MAKIMVNGITPNALNATQKSVVWVRQTISFRTVSYTHLTLPTILRV